ncbi:hypothetical protein CDAR_1541 [Caerostris darwini]|uniref:Uncharacterized protein n=1 Tax=Caerostris darwini TaxID=1538125 RepID=A0AAV4R6M7_9ARAC|nr:hypothetical protein CDAR_1541 [Caerostris darwini]
MWRKECNLNRGDYDSEVIRVKLIGYLNGGIEQLVLQQEQLLTNRLDQLATGTTFYEKFLRICVPYESRHSICRCWSDQAV